VSIIQVFLGDSNILETLNVIKTKSVPGI